MKCILRRCINCPKYRLFDVEKNLTDRDPHISFHVFEKIAKCSIHGVLKNNISFCPMCKDETKDERKGVFSNLKQMILKKTSFHIFINDYYLPMLEKYAYHRPHYILLGKNVSGLTRKKAMKPGDIETTRDYAERLSFKLDKEIMSLNFGNSVSLSMEGVSVRYFKKEVSSDNVLDKETFFDFEKDTILDFHSHLSDSCIQNAGSTHQHMIVLLDFLFKNKYMTEGSTLFCNTDGESKQYRCANSLYYLSLLSTKYNINIDRAIGAPGHGKNIVDGLNAVDKHYLKKIMRITKKASETDSNIKKLTSILSLKTNLFLFPNNQLVC